MKILLLTHFYRPEVGAPQRRWSAFVNRFMAAGHELTVVTGLPHYPSGHRLPGTSRRVFQKEEGEDGETVVRVPFIPGDRSSTWKLMDQAAVAGLSTLAGLLIQHDVVVATIPGLPTAFGARAVHALRGTPLVLEMRDAWPDLIEQAGLARGRSARWLSSAITDLQRRSDRVVTVSQRFARVLTERAIDRVTVVPNGVDLTVVPLLPPREPTERLEVLYLGTHGVSQGLDTVIAAAAALGGSRCHLTMIGDGSEKPHLQHMAHELGAPVDFRDVVSGPDLWKAYEEADTCVVSLRDWPAFRYTIPSKLYEILATGRHVTGVVEGEAADMIAASGGGFTVRPGDAAGLAERWADMDGDGDPAVRGRSARGWVAENASYDVLAERYLAVLADVARGST